MFKLVNILSTEECMKNKTKYFHIQMFLPMTTMMMTVMMLKLMLMSFRPSIKQLLSYKKMFTFLNIFIDVFKN